MGIEYEYRISIKGITIFTSKSLMFQASLIGRDMINFEIRRRNLKEKKVNKTEREKRNIVVYSKMLTFYINQSQANKYWPDYLTMSILWLRLYHFNKLWLSF